MDVLQTVANANFRDLNPKSTRKTKVEGFIRCQHCGFPIKESRTSRGNGWDGNITTKAVTLTSGGSSTVAFEPIVNGGCPFCGSSNY